MPSLPSIFDQRRPRPEVRAGELPDAIFAADLWEVFCQRAHRDYQDPARFFTGAHPTENLKLLIKEVTERLAGMEGGTPIFRYQRGNGAACWNGGRHPDFSIGNGVRWGKSHALMATVHVAREGERLAERLSDYRIERFPEHGAAQVAAFVGEESDPLRGQEHEVEGQRVRTYTPWGKLLCWPEGSPGTITYARTTSKVLHQVALPCGRLLAIGPS